MKILNYIKLFEDYDDDDISEKGVIFSVTKEDVEDLLLSLSDQGFKLEIKELYLDSEDFSEISNRGSNEIKANFRKKMLSNQVRGGYLIDIIKERVDDDLHGFRYNNKEDIKVFNLLMTEISQLSKRVDYMEWSPYGTKRSNGISSHDVIDDRVWMKLFIVCPLPQKTTMAKKMAKGEYKSNLSSCINSEIWKIKEKVESKFTASFKSALRSWQGLYRDEIDYKGKIFFLFKPVSKNVLNINTRKLDELRNKFTIKPIDQFRKEYPDFKNAWINDSDTSFVLEVEYDAKRIEMNCKLELKSRFISRQND